MEGLLQISTKSTQFFQIEEAVNKGETIEIYGAVPSFKPYLFASLCQKLDKCILWITSSWNNCEKFYENTHPFLPEEMQSRLLVFPELRETGDHDLTPALRMKALKMLADGGATYIITPYKALLQLCEDTGELKEEALIIRQNMEISLDDAIEKLENLGYTRNYLVEARGEYSRRGGILDVYSSTSEPVRIEFFGDEVESLRTFDLNSQVSTGKITETVIYPCQEQKREKKLLDLLPKNRVVIVDEPTVIKFHATERALDEENNLWDDFQYELAGINTVNLASWGAEDKREGVFFNTKPLDTFAGNIDKFIKQLTGWRDEGAITAVSTQQMNRFKGIFRELKVDGVRCQVPKRVQEGNIILLPGLFGEGFYWEDTGFRFVCDKDILGAAPRRKRVLRTWDKSKAVNLSDLSPGDKVVHISHGIGVFRGLAHLKIEGLTKDFVELEYHKGDKLYVPIQQLDLLQKYIGPENKAANLSRLGGTEWAKTRSKVKASTEAIADELLKLYSEREQTPGFQFSPDSPWQWELEAGFPFEETPDQETVIEEVKKDQESLRSMDRLVCGDAGYGKTEVALRAAFKVVLDGKQAAVLVPTTILATQHYETFKSRLAPFPTRVEMVSRFRSKKEQREILEKLALGEVDVIIGTHRLLSKDVKFKDLGLMIIDEEQHFGVVQKEKLKKIKASVDVLTLSATPIPRTLHLSLSGMRDISVIETPPEDRLPVKTHLTEYNNDLIRSAIIREMERGGQVFFIHNRVQDIERVAHSIQKLVPFAKVAIGHGQMDEESLEILMLDFLEGNFNVLVCTTIVESGLDIPNANTIIINNAQNFGLSQLYQLRGRVGRSHQQAFAYLLYPSHVRLTEDAMKRLEVIRDFTHFGAGFQIAMKDLEIRGAGNILGAEQSGCIAAVGFDLYCQLLREAVDEKRGIPHERKLESPIIDLPVDAFIPEDYISDSNVKLQMYRKISQINKEALIKDIMAEFKDRFGPLPKTVENLLEVLKIKLLAWDLGAPYIKEIKGEVHILLPGVKNIPLKRIQNLFEKSGLAARFYKSILVVENLFKTDTKMLTPQTHYGKPQEWLPKLQKFLAALYELKRKGKI